MSVSLLSDLLKKQIVLHKSLLQISEEKTEVIKKNDVSSLREITKKERQHIKAITQLENSRNELISSLSSDLSVQISNVSDLIKFLDDENKTLMLDLTEELKEVLENLQYHNELNQQLIEQSLRFVEMSIDILLPEPQSINYKQQGEEEVMEKSRSIFDSKA